MKTKGWAIIGTRGIYLGWWHTRKEAIQFHIEALGKTWAQCKVNGDRAVKVEISIKDL